jgi:hypothetical protein
MGKWLREDEYGSIVLRRMGEKFAKFSPRGTYGNPGGLIK